MVESAYREPKPAPPPVTPDFSGTQGYRNAAPGGIEALYAATIPGGTGTNVRIIDIEYSWNLAHENLAGANQIANGTPTDPFSDTDHGTAVLGEIRGTDNSIGMTGLAPGAWLGVVNADDTGSLDVADAIDIAAANLSAGDVILIEQQTAGANGGCDSTSQVGCVAVEWVQAVYDAVAAATADGINVAEAAGNGSQDLDGTEYGGGSASSFPDGRADSGAIIVGAGAAPGCSSPARPAGFLVVRQPGESAGLGRARRDYRLRRPPGRVDGQRRLHQYVWRHRVRVRSWPAPPPSCRAWHSSRASR